MADGLPPPEQHLLFPEAEPLRLDIVSVRRVVSHYTDAVAESLALEEAYGTPARSAREVADLLRPIIGDESVEVFVTLLLDGRHRVTGFAETSRGTLTSSLVHPREVFGPAVRMGAAAVIVGHNHPSGDPAPSAEDVDVTKRLRDAGQLLGVPLLDHVVVGEEGRFSSLRERLSWE